MEYIANLTQHNASYEQVVAGVRELTEENRKRVKELITFRTLEEANDKGGLIKRANELADIVLSEGYRKAMIGGAPYFMGTLETVLKERGIQPLHVFHTRKSIDKLNENGELIRTSVFYHEGFVEAHEIISIQWEEITCQN